jgi:hypothetical protein
MDGSGTGNARVGAATVCINGDNWAVFCSYLGMGRMEVFDSKLWEIGVAL